MTASVVPTEEAVSSLDEALPPASDLRARRDEVQPLGRPRMPPLGDVGRVVSNSISGAVINLAVEADKTGAVVGEVTGNTMSGAQGQNGFGTCTIRADYTVFTPHTGWIVLQPDWWFQLQFDDGVCTPWDFIP